ncbi:MAG: oligosaccharide flippase family protein [archaeon]|nr:oligosaccharide flippase family protein [archaeon]
MSAHARRLSPPRDAAWLGAAEVAAVVLGLLGQVVLTRALLASAYGRWVLLLDLFLAAYLVVDAGLPTVIARDGPRSRSALRHMVGRAWRVQVVLALLASLVAVPMALRAHGDVVPLVLLSAGVSLLHIATYAPRAALRAHGEARFEAWSKLAERLVMTAGYTVLYVQGQREVLPYAVVLAVGAGLGLVTSVLLMRRCVALEEDAVLPTAWSSGVRPLLRATAPFAVTAGLAPLALRLEKFILAGLEGHEAVALLHVAQLALLAGYVVPASVRAALLPALGEHRDDAERLREEVARAEGWMAPLIPFGLLAGALVVEVLVPLAFPAAYSDGSLGVDARALFVLMLPAWGAAMLAAPALGAVQAGPQPWRYAAHAAFGILVALLAGLMLIPRFGVAGAALTTSLTAVVMALAALALRPDPNATCWPAWGLGLLSMLLVPTAWMMSPWRAAAVTLPLLLAALWLARSMRRLPTGAP